MYSVYCNYSLIQITYKIFITCTACFILEDSSATELCSIKINEQTDDIMT